MAATARSLTVAALIWLLPLTAAVQTRPAVSVGASDSGVLEILASGTRVGTERFQIKNSGSGWETTAELQVEVSGTKMAETSALRIDAARNPVSYQRTQKAPLTATLTVQFGGNAETTLISNAGDEPLEQVFYLPQNDLAVLDTNFFHHYALLLLHYNRARGGPQPFNVFVPQESLPGTITLTFVANEPAAGGGSSAPLDHFKATSEELEIEIWATPEGALQRLSIPSAGLEVVRQ